MAFNVSTTIGATNTKYTATEIGAKIPMGSGYIPVSYATGKNDQNSQSGNQFAVGYVHNLSKRTALYTTYSTVSNKNAGTKFVVGAGQDITTAGGKSTGLDVGIRHSF